MFWKWLHTLVLEIRDTLAPVDNPHSTYETGQSFVYPVRMLAAFWVTMSLMIVMVGISWIAFGKLSMSPSSLSLSLSLSYTSDFSPPLSPCSSTVITCAAHYATHRNCPAICPEDDV
eukprot:TRINITY_DN16061_c0_g1_i11.p1 TRINITY_DN16061_c0_g1~~TRINITY_DN16061_c0_g1_i11.p1  ORF type:complete len:117 (+),score=5.56 TRINITY_DN16061_c0_g1_i11:2-352(+)